VKKILFLFFTSTFCFCQRIQIVDRNSKEPISYATLTKLDDGKGSFADVLGFASFDLNQTSKYIISCIGYQNDTIVPFNSPPILFLKPNIYDLQSFEIVGRKTKSKEFEVGFYKSFSLVPYYSSLPRKMSVCTFIPFKRTSNASLISKVKLNIGAGKSKIYDSFVVRIYIKENHNKFPGKDLLKSDMVVKINQNSFKYNFPLKELVRFPENGCFVGFEVIGKIDKQNNFSAFSDFYKKPERPFEFVAKLVKSDSYSLVKYGGFESWFNNKRNDRKPDTYAIGLELIELEN
jgi:hypothetical protein